MATPLLALAVAVLAAATIVAIARWRRAAAPRVITCPENGATHAVRVDPLHRFRRWLRGDRSIRLSDCTRWPEMADCDQPCRGQIAAAPDGCVVRSRLEAFYLGKECVSCGRPFGAAIDWHQNKPGLIGADRHVRTWLDFPPEQLPRVLETHHPLCWDCTMVQKVYEKHPERITERPSRRAQA